MSEWITDREPHYRDDGYYVFNAYGKVTHWAQIQRGEAWMPIVSPDPYVKPTYASETIHCRDCAFCMETEGGKHTGYFDQCTFHLDTRFCGVERRPRHSLAVKMNYCGQTAQFFQPKRTS